MIRFDKFISEKHYEIVKEWWEGHRWPVIPLASLPINNGIVCYFGDKPVCSGFIYKTETNIAWMEWVLCDPKADREYRGECIDGLIDELSDMAKNLGFTVIFTSVKNASLMKRLEKSGFNQADTEVTNLIKVL